MQGIFRKSAIGLAILGFAGAASAGTLTGAFIGAEGVDFQARNGDLDFVTVYPTATPGVISTTNIHPTYSWGYRIFGGLTFCDNEDITVSWLRYHTSNENDFGTPVGTSPTSPLASTVRWLDTGGSGTDDVWTSIAGNVNFDLDDVYGVFGHRVMLGPWTVRFAGGLDWVRLNSDMDVAATQTVSGTSSDYEYDAHSHMHGFGPRVEFDFVYHLPYGFAAFAKPTATLFIATREVTLDGDDSPTAINTYDFSHRYVVVPKVGIRMGLAYTYGFGDVGGEGAGPMNNCAFTIEAGWQADAYIHAIERPEGFNNGTGAMSGTTGISNTTTKVSNYAFQGFFIGGMLSTNW